MKHLISQWYTFYIYLFVSHLLKVITIILTCILFSGSQLYAQKTDSVYKKLRERKGIIGWAAKAVLVDPPKDEDDNVNNATQNKSPYTKYNGYYIRNIYVTTLGFDQNLDDTLNYRRNFGNKVANVLHTNTRKRVMLKNLFFNTGDSIIPDLLADNERFLRQMGYLQDAKIILRDPYDSIGKKWIDVQVISRDIFSIGADLNIISPKLAEGSAREENFAGLGNHFLFRSYYNQERDPKLGFLGEYEFRNVLGSFTNLYLSANNFSTAFDNGKKEELVYRASLSKPLVNIYSTWTGAASYDLHTHKNIYSEDSVFKQLYDYQYQNMDVWLGYNLSSLGSIRYNLNSRYKQFVSSRIFKNNFLRVPLAFRDTLNAAYTPIHGVLFGYTWFRQDYFKTKYIYGFGRNEDLPVGFKISASGGWTDKQGISRPYFGIGLQRNFFDKKQNYYNFTGNFGTHLLNGIQDGEMLINLEYIGHLRKLNHFWKIRNYISGGIAQQYNNYFNGGLMLNSNFGIPQLPNPNYEALYRMSLKLETVFFNNFQFIGIKIAPFVFAEAALLSKSAFNFDYSEVYTSLGAGLRARNDNLVYGTVQLKAYYFPKVANNSIERFKLEFTTNLQYRYSSSFINRPDFISAN